MRPAWRRESRGRRQRYLLHPEDEEAVVEVGEVKVQEDSGRVKDVGVDLLQEVLLLVVKRLKKAPQSPRELDQALTTLT